MDKWIRKLSGMLLASVLAVSLSGKASAEGGESEVPPENPPAIIEANAETPLRGESAQETPESGGEDAGAERSGPRLVVAGEEIDLEEDLAPEDGGWRYDAASGRVMLTDYSGASALIGTESRDLTIQASGFNRVGSLVGDGDITVIGSGILLVDDIEMPEGKQFSLQPNEDIYGSLNGGVAVFRLQEDGSYQLINGSVVGILDEDCTILEGLTLVVPEDGKLMLQCVSRQETGGETVYCLDADQEESYGAETTTPQLTISEQAKLVIKENAEFSFNHIDKTGNLLVFTPSGNNDPNNDDPSGSNDPSGNNNDPSGNNDDPNSNNDDPNGENKDPDGENQDPGDEDDPDGEDVLVTVGDAPGQPQIRTDGRGVYTLSLAGAGDGALAEPVALSLRYSGAVPAAGEALYVVFRNSDGTLTAYAAVYDPETGLLRFTAQMTGPFVVVCLRFDGEAFSPAFYEALAKSDAVQKL